MKDFVLVKLGEEDSFISKAKDLGFSELVLCYSKSDEKKFTKDHKKQVVENSDLKLYFAMYCDEKAISKKNSSFDGLIGLGTSLNSDFLGVDFILNNEFGKEKDAIHQRRSGLNHIILAKCKEKNIEILTSVNSFINLPIDEKAIVLGRIKQNVKACKRAGVTYSLISFADKIEKMKSANDLKTLRKLIETPLK